MLFTETAILRISGFRHEVDENRALLGYYVTSSDNALPAFRDNYRPHLGFLILQDGSDRLSQNVGKELPLLAE